MSDFAGSFPKSYLQMAVVSHTAERLAGTTSLRTRPVFPSSNDSNISWSSCLMRGSFLGMSVNGGTLDMTVVRVMVVCEVGLGDERVRSIKTRSKKWMALISRELCVKGTW